MTAPAPLDLTALLDDLERAHERWRAGGFDGFTAVLDLTAAVPTLIAELRKRDGALRAVEALAEEWATTPAEDPGLAAYTAMTRLRSTLTAALSPESVQS